MFMCFAEQIWWIMGCMFLSISHKMSVMKLYCIGEMCLCRGKKEIQQYLELRYRLPKNESYALTRLYPPEKQGPDQAIKRN